MPTLRNCVKCGEHIVLGDRFCAHCGAEQPATLGGGLTEAHSSRWDDIEKRLKTATEGRYNIRGLIGRGGMAAVYLADWPQMDLRVAIKVMDPYLLDQETFVQRFLQEARTIAKLKHRHIIRVYDSGQFGDLYYFSMDYFPGRSLEKVLSEEGPLPFPVVKLWLSQAADALGYAHRQPKPIVHRDVKPSNILLDSEGDLVITDFGIAKVRDVGRTLSSPSLTMPGAVLGTPTYLSPEQASLILNPEKAGKEGRVTSASDQYALGVLAYEMLAGAPPFSGDLGPLLQAHAEKNPPPILEKRPDCPRDLAELVMRMLEKVPKDRWPSMHHVCAKLSVPSPPPGNPFRLQLVGYARGYKPVGSVSMLPPSGEIFEGQRFRLVATPLDVTGKPLRDRPLSWRSSDPEIALVTEEGQVTVLRSGPVSITATADGVSGEVRLEVAPVKVDAVVVLPSRLSLSMGEEGALRTILFSSDGRELDGREVTWSSSDGTIAKVSAEGTVSALRLGRAAITVTCEGLSCTVTVEVIPVPVASVELSPPSLALEVGEVSAFRCSVRDAMGRALEERSTKWTADDLSIVDLSGGGRVVGLRPGQATVTVECDAVSGIGVVTVSPERVVSLQISPNPVELMEGDELQLAAVPSGARGAELPDRTIVWESGSPEVVEVDEGGLLWGIQPGKATIIARCDGKESSVAVSVAEAPVSSVDLLPTQVTLAVGDSIRLHAMVRGKDGRELGHRPMVWASSDESMVVVGEDGLIRAVAEGETSVVAQCQGREASAKVLVRPLPVVSLEVSESRGVLETDEPRTLLPVSIESAKRIPKRRNLTRSSSRPEVPEVSEVAGTGVQGEGRVGALTSGATRASAMREDGRAEGLLGVNPVPVASVEVVAPARGVRVKQRRQMEAVIRGADGSRLKGRKVLWDTSDPKVAEVDASSGGLRALSEGSVRVTARCEEVEGHRTLTIQPSGVAPFVWVAGIGGVAILAAILLVWRFSLPVEEGVPGVDWAGPPGDVVEEMAAPVATVELTADRETVTVNNEVRLEAFALDEEGTALEDRRVEWRTSDPAVASVTALGSVATVLARRAGTALITATVGDVTGSLEVRVQEVAPAPSPAESSPVITAIRIEPAQGVLDVGETRQLRAADQGGSPVVATYRTSDPAVAAISSQGALRARRPGTVTVTASYAELTAEAQFQVREVVVEEAAPIPTLSEATADSIRSSLKAVEEHGSMAEYDTAYEILGRVGLRLAELKIQFPVAPSLLEDLEKDYREQFQRTYENCEFYRQAMMGREQSPPSCRPPPTGGGNDAR